MANGGLLPSTEFFEENPDYKTCVYLSQLIVSKMQNLAIIKDMIDYGMPTDIEQAVVSLQKEEATSLRDLYTAFDRCNFQ